MLISVRTLLMFIFISLPFLCGCQLMVYNHLTVN
nr:MAG TPA: hypothetical protein [Caudoviricetes sp.]